MIEVSRLNFHLKVGKYPKNIEKIFERQLQIQHILFA
jgi:hypothetical protein